MDTVEWIRRTAHPLTTVDPADPLDDLRPLVGMVGDAAVVGYGAGTRGAHEVFALQDRIARLLVGEAGFRVVAFDLGWTLGARLDAAVRGEGDPAEVLAGAEAFADTEEVLALLRWVGGFNRAHPDDPVRVVGVSPHAVGPEAYDTVAAHVPEAAEAYDGLRPDGDVAAHARRLRAAADRRSRVERARAAHDLVAARGAGPLVLRSARMIVQFHELHDHDGRPEDPMNMGYHEKAFAENVEWWHRHTGRRVLFWSSSSHTCDGLRRGFPPFPSHASRNAGSHLRERLGDGYLSLGITFHEGELATYGEPGTRRVPETGPDLAEATLDAAGDGYLLDLRAGPPPPAGRWLDREARFRVVGRPTDDGSHYMTGGSPREWFDVLAHWRRVTPARRIRRG
ncbi:erythromycin esterase family protein [Actinomadura kijaniata]|uniref:erythromycin esterase family protein n=1 Tax=Actinomadura kijaniata TaxID=46161 RepID=UPI003F1CBA48